MFYSHLKKWATHSLLLNKKVASFTEATFNNRFSQLLFAEKSYIFTTFCTLRLPIVIASIIYTPLEYPDISN